MIGLNKDRMSLFNRTLVLREFYTNKRLTIQDISRSLNLSIPTISYIIRGLEEVNYIYKDSSIKNGKGRHQGFWALNHTKEYYIVMDISPYEVKGLIIDAAGNTQTGIIRIKKDFVEIQELLEASVEIIKELTENFPTPITYVGIGIHGIVDYQNGVSIFMPKIQSKKVSNIVKYLEKATNLKIKIDNDCNIKALSEKWLGDAKNIDNFIWVNLDYGIGASLIIHGELFRGNQFSAGQIGHISISKDGPICSCGNTGCLELYFSEQAILNLLKISWSNSVYIKSIEIEKLTLDIFIDLVAQDNPIATSTLLTVSDRISHALLMLIHVISPEHIFLGGRLSKLGTPFLKIVQNYIEVNSIYKQKNSQTISISKLEEKQLLAGAIFLWIEDQLSLNKF